ncbi:monovalent cation:proton antiporter-2 (CPA2) family protein [Mannheimia sp. AT1]|uniref:Monovalent cation:proton antiporter-2 (CPA2) family protein n=1 Tax=Mannheimia cairinae TaxID=3025936 RepID=A0ABT5MNW3_9PAST|nr:monovalent cation:proton antiporter-2 (CPA2) family protein [Mannheimia cairinae]MDD0823870.1 monovalent cation:proton antiporter-2 (CPA2) family protein [Mannheimia cairinae]MDD0825186.1 monovalent cation:proton antiporter-2 (CPA2) family protein [Mannheimia cairinae]
MSSLASPELVKTVVLLATSVTIVPLFKRVGLGSVLGYLVAGCLVGPSGIGLFQDPTAVVHMAELGVVMFLFIIGLEMHPELLWAMRKAIFGRGLLQVATCGTLLTLAGIYLLGFSKEVAFIAGMGFALSSTAIVMQVLEDKGINSTPKGQRIVATLLFEDLAIVPLLASVAFLAPSQASEEPSTNWAAIGISLVAVLTLIAAGKWLINPVFRVISKAKVREMMTAAALLVVLGAALLMEISGLSMAMGAFLAGVMLSESSFRHQLEADIEPFRGLLLGLFFMGVGMSLDLSLVLNNWLWLLAIVTVYVIGKGVGIFTIAVFTRLPLAESIMRTTIMAHGGEFAFVLFSAAATVGILSPDNHATLTAAVIVSMLLSPLLLLIKQGVKKKKAKNESPNMTGVEVPEDLEANVLVIGFGRFNQIVCQVLLARGLSVSVIDSDTDHIRAAARFGFKVYYGDGARLDVLRASGIANANCVIIGVGKPDRTERIVELIKSEYPLVPIFARTFDRQSAVDLVKKHHIDYYVRETFESALTLSQAAIEHLGSSEHEAKEIINYVRRLDSDRFNEEVLHGFSAEVVRKYWVPTPWISPQHEGTALNAETADMLEELGENVEVAEVEFDDIQKVAKEAQPEEILLTEENSTSKSN